MNEYELINSKTIADYCQKIKHKFNTEELTVLIYRNTKMDIFEKIDKYKELIKNYPDMEVIERCNCSHYDSVKELIQTEIDRLEKLYNDFTKNDENSIYNWNEYNKSTKKMGYDALDNTEMTYKKIYNKITDYINEFDDTIYFTISKKIFNKKDRVIYANYNVIDKKPKLIRIYESGEDFLDIDSIFINIPTPFKRGDILVSKDERECTDTDIFVLDYLCTWRDGLEAFLARGNYDSTDMLGYGYYLCNEDSPKFIRDDKWNYDRFEYYKGELKGNTRILKAVSSLIKDEIDIELFTSAYDIYKKESENISIGIFTDEGLKLAGFTEEDLQKKAIL